jgi:hypothetical protein
VAKRSRGGVASRYLQWKGQPQIGCLFAQALSRKPDGHGQRIDVLNGQKGAGLASRIDAIAHRELADPESQAATIIIPRVTTLEPLVEMATTLKSMVGWQVEHWIEPTTPTGPIVAFRITREVPIVGGTTVPSEALVMGPFDVFPETRRAPVTAMEIFIATASAKDIFGRPRDKANLADIVFEPALNPTAFSIMWDRTKKLRGERLADPQDRRARAKVSFVVPLPVAKALGYAS